MLPLANLSGDPSQDAFADGLTDELISTLGRIGDLQIISRTSVTQFKGTSRSVPDVARLLNVDAILEGSVRVVPSPEYPAGQEPPVVRINARLILAGTDTQLWNRTFERVRTDALGLQSEVAEAVAQEVNRRLVLGNGDAQAAPTSGSGDAQAAYLEGRSYLVNVDRDGMMKARAALERAVQLDRNFARAHAALSVCYVFLELTGVLSRADAYGRAEGAARRALDLDRNLPEAHSALADLRFLYDWNWSEAGDSYRQALALNPSYTFARRQDAWYLAALGRGAEALQQARLAESADPLSPDALSAVAMTLAFRREDRRSHPSDATIDRPRWRASAGAQWPGACAGREAGLSRGDQGDGGCHPVVRWHARVRRGTRAHSRVRRRPGHGPRDVLEAGTDGQDFDRLHLSDVLRVLLCRAGRHGGGVPSSRRSGSGAKSVGDVRQSRSQARSIAKRSAVCGSAEASGAPG